MLSREDIKKAAGYSYSKGVELYNQNKVHSFSYDEKGRYDLIEGWVKGSSRNLYSVSINVDREKGKLEDCDCECKAFLNYGGLCKHCVAVLLAYIAQKNQKQAILEYLESLRGNYAEKNKSRNGFRVLSDVKQITFDENDLESFEKTYNQIKLAIEKKDVNLLPTSANGFKNQLLEIAPKGVKGDDAYVNFFKRDKTKVAFMISKKLLVNKLNI